MPNPTRRMYRTPEESFRARTVLQDGCLIWTGAVKENGYGVIWTGDRLTRAHRYAWERVNGAVPNGMDLDHICGNRVCCDVTHLRVVTRKQNMEHRTKLNSNNTSGVRGVDWSRKSNKWRARLKHNYREYVAGYFDTVAEAEQAIIDLRNKLFTHNDEDRQEAPRKAA